MTLAKPESTILEVPSGSIYQELKYKKGLGDEIIAAAMIVSEMQQLGKKLDGLREAIEKIEKRMSFP